MLKKIVLATALVFGANASAGSFDTTPLIGLEGGYTGGHINETFDDLESGYNVGLKLGAESEEFRAYLSGRIYNFSDLTTMQSGGVDLHYLIPVVDEMNIFLGLNGGAIRLNDKAGDKQTRGYFGGEAGVDFDLSKKLGLELSYKMIKIDAAASAYPVGYLSNITASLVFKLPSK